MLYIPIISLTQHGIGLEKTIMQCRTCGTAISTDTQQCPACGSLVSTEQQQNHAPAFSAKAATSPYLTQSPTAASSSSTSTDDLPSYLSIPDQELYSKVLPDSPESLSIPTSPSRKKRKPGLLAGMIVGLLLVVLIGTALIILPALTTPSTPSGNAIITSAAAFITDITTTSSVDPMTAAPGPITQTFKTYATVYVAFHLNSKNFDFTAHHAAYVQARFYSGKTYIYQRMLIFTHQASGGFFAVQYNQATAGNVELYWCLKSDCSDGELAQTTPFTITA
jgi:hypothetical protein